MRRDIGEEWVKRLRSGEYVQGTAALHSINEAGTHMYCCLGVLCEIAVEQGVVHRRYVTKVDAVKAGYVYGNSKEEESTAYLPDSVKDWAGMPDNMGLRFTADGFGDLSLASLNDSGSEFEDIADIIEREFIGEGDWS